MEQLEAFFKFEKLPKTIKLDSGTILPDVQGFVHLNMERLRNNINHESPDMIGRKSRLLKLKALIQEGYGK